MPTRRLTLGAIVALAVGVVAALQVGGGTPAVACPIDGFVGADPPIDAAHIFCGDINRDGEAVGFHARPGGIDPATVSGTGRSTPEPEVPGVYVLRDFTITVAGRSARKPISTMFPDACDRDAVLAAIRHAYDAATETDGNRFRGLSGPTCTDAEGEPFPVTGFTSTRGGLHIRTAYPN
jgi:hypothetical protein